MTFLEWWQSFSYRPDRTDRWIAEQAWNAAFAQSQSELALANARIDYLMSPALPQPEGRETEMSKITLTNVAAPCALDGCALMRDEGMREAIIEECADVADQKLDHFSGTECTYRCDVADAIRALKSTPPQKDETK